MDDGRYPGEERTQRSGHAVLRENCEELSAVGHGAWGERQAKGVWSAGAATRSRLTRMDDSRTKYPEATHEHGQEAAGIAIERAKGTIDGGGKEWTAKSAAGIRDRHHCRHTEAGRTVKSRHGTRSRDNARRSWRDV